MTTIVCITSKPITISTGDTYDYSGEDRILRNILTNEHEVFYSGQNQGKDDYKLIESVESQSLFKVYYRNSSNLAIVQADILLCRCFRKIQLLQHLYVIHNQY
jgi:hypothetical protein